jgi:hypothetical protein
MPTVKYDDFAIITPAAKRDSQTPDYRDEAVENHNHLVDARRTDMTNPIAMCHKSRQLKRRFTG